MTKDNSKELTSSINIKVTEEQREQLGALAEDTTLKDMVLSHTIYSDKDKQIKELKGTLSSYEKENELLNEQLERGQLLENKIDSKDSELTSLKERVTSLTGQLEQANIRLDDFTKLLDQQQQLQLSTVSANEQLKDQIQLLESSKDNNSDSNGSSDTMGFFARLFNI